MAKNHKFFWLLHEPKGTDRRPLWTIEKIAKELGFNRSRLVEVFKNKPGCGGHTRKRLVPFLKREFPKTWAEILKTLGWDEAGNLTPHPQPLSPSECGEGGVGLRLVRGEELVADGAARHPYQKPEKLHVQRSM